MTIRKRYNEGVAVASGDIGCGICIMNDVGGTGNLPHGRYHVLITSGWDDDEIGRRLVGKLLDKKDIAVAREIGTTTHMPKVMVFDPSIIYFSGRRFEEAENRTIQAIKEALWPGGDVDHPWSPDTLDEIAGIMHRDGHGVVSSEQMK